jgi:hypothetical protein
MADSPIYENPNGRRRRAARGSTHFRDYIKNSKDEMEKLTPGLKYNTVEQAANVTGRDVTAPWADGANFRSGIGEGRTSVDYGYNKKEIQEFIQETARVAQADYGLDNIRVNTVYGIDDSLDGMEGQFTWNSYNVNDNHIDIYTDTIWKNTALDENGNLLEDGVERFKERIKYTIGHEMRHQWQHTTEEGKAIEEADDLYKQTKINDYTDDYDKYYHEPVEVDARYNGEKFRKTYELKLKKYKEKLEKQGFNKELQDKIDEINLRPKNKIIGHQFEKEPIDIGSYRKFDNVEPIDWDIDTGNESPINKYDVSKNTRYRNAKLNKGQKNLRPTITMNGNNVEIDSIYNHSVPKKLQPKANPKIVGSIDPGVDSDFELVKKSTVGNNKTRTRGKKKNTQSTGRGNKKRRVQSTGRVNKNTIKTGSKKAPALKRRGKSSKLRAVGRNGKALNNIPRKAIPLSKKDIVKTAANLIVNEAATNTASTIIKNVDDINTPKVDNPTPEPNHSNAPEPEIETPNGYSEDPTTWTDEDIADMADGDPDLYQELLNQREQARNGNANTNSNKFADDPNDPTTWSDDYIEEMSEGDPHYYEELRQRREKAFEEAINSQGPKPPGPFSDDFDPNDPSTWTDNDKRRMNTPDQWTDDDIRKLADGDMDRADELNRMRNGEFGPYGHNPINDFDFDDAPVPDTSYKHAPDTEILDNSISTKTLSKMDVAMTGFNIIGAIGDYKSYRREGDGVISAGIKTGAKFAIEEALGFWALPIALVKSVPGMAIKGADALYKENRRMNSAANFTLFGDAQFMDTQQLATMRQSGMEMAKMSQYNLQQTLMGNEAQYLHR